MADLPPLPEPAGATEMDDGPKIYDGKEIGRLTFWVPAYTADQMRAYGTACAEHARKEALQRAQRQQCDIRAAIREAEGLNTDEPGGARE